MFTSFSRTSGNICKRCIIVMLILNLKKNENPLSLCVQLLMTITCVNVSKEHLGVSFSVESIRDFRAISFLKMALTLYCISNILYT